MKSFWEELTSRLAAVNLTKPTHQPDNQLEEGYKIIGVANEAAQKFYIVWRELAAEHDAWKEQAEKEVKALKATIPHDGVDQVKNLFNKLEREHDQIHELRDLARALFWNEVKTQFPDANKDGETMSINEGWNVSVGTDKEEPPIISVVSIGGLDGLGELLADGISGRSGRRRK